MKMIKEKEVEYELADKDALLIETLQELTQAINRMRLK